MRRAVPIVRLGGPLVAPQGLSTAEAVAQRAIYGRNDIVEAPRRPWRDLVRETATDPMIWFLVGTGSALRRAREPRRGRHAVRGPRARCSAWTPSCTGAPRPRPKGCAAGSPSRPPSCGTARLGSVPAAEPSCPATSRSSPPARRSPPTASSWRAQDLQADESSLTGEAYPVSQAAARRACRRVRGAASWRSDIWGFAGTRLLTGQARLRVVFTGGETLYGRDRALGRPRRARRARLCRRAVAGLVATLVAAAALALPHPRLRPPRARATGGSTRC